MAHHTEERAHLIAAAPALLEACKNAVASEEGRKLCAPEEGCGICWVCRCNAAIAKAEGKP
jgi:hypothetical protein